MEPIESHPRTVAVVVNWNGAALLRRNLSTWREQSVPFARVLIVDNGSQDGSVELLDGCPYVETVRLAKNQGFAAGANRGIEEALEDPEVDCIALVNNDVALDSHWHEEVLAALDERAGIGGVASCLLAENEPTRVQTAGIEWSDERGARDYLSGKTAPSAASEVTEIFGVSAAAALLRREVFESVGLFDESFFAYQEDVDLALRSRSHGWRFLLAPAARGVHAGHSSNRRFPLGGTWADFYNARNRIAVVAKSLPAGRWPRAAAGQASTWLRSWPEGRAGAVSVGLAHGCLRLPRSLRFRLRGRARGAPDQREPAPDP
jgi:GT2 family glycosyltransferase